MNSNLRIVVIIIVLCILVLFLNRAYVLGQSGQVNAESVPSNAKPENGDKIDVSINIDMTGVNPPDNKLGSYTGKLTWDHIILKYAGYSGGTTSGWGSPTVNETNVANGEIRFSGANASGSIGNVNVINVKLEVIGSAGTSTVLDLEFTAMASALTFKSLLGILSVDNGNVTVKGSVPVELSTFQVSLVQEQILLEWITLSEIHNLGFEIQRARENPADLIPIGFVPGNGTSVNSHHYHFKDPDISKGSYFYRLKQVDTYGSCKLTEIKKIIVRSITNFELKQNYPNPFNPATFIRYEIHPNGIVNVKFRVYNILGELVRKLVDEAQAPGPYSVLWDGKNDAGTEVGAGVYVGILSTPQEACRIKMIYAK